ncbi:SOS response-associated peptidase [Paenibacillus barengoltzii]|uniref:Abasic site processing protein n=1 Tax=Paenibacillus barengoltzii J12 TaxID=935846 RepID=A0ABY1LTI8_9BACL|nr:SOS response-associated peptidase [Paenibacillus barengoltzii]SMF00921.1 Putative SOS response-associated peptidase YedK [Paenibacillus barengoltzii J12]
MCGRFTITLPLDELIVRYLIMENRLAKFAPNYNVAPMQFIPAIIEGKQGNRLGELRWGLVPSWAKEDKIGASMINARAESLPDKPAFRKLLTTRRCLIPADGFYEWQQRAGGKQPYRIVMKDGSPFAFAGLYDIWTDPQGNKLATCTIITTEPNSLMAEIHSRMPVILQPKHEAEWLDRDNTDTGSLLKLLQPYDAAKMRAYPVSSAVGNVRNNTKELLEEAK